MALRHFPFLAAFYVATVIDYQNWVKKKIYKNFFLKNVAVFYKFICRILSPSNRKTCQEGLPPLNRHTLSLWTMSWYVIVENLYLGILKLIIKLNISGQWQL